MARQDRGFEPEKHIRFGDRDVARDVDDEISFHLESTIDELMTAGWEEDAAREEARRRFGEVETWSQQIRRLGAQQHQRRERRLALTGLALEIRHAWRGLRRERGFAAAAILTLGLGIGLTTAIFSLIEGILLRPLPYAEPDRLVRIYAANPERGWQSLGVSGPDIGDIRDTATAFAELAVYRNFEANSRQGERVFRVEIIDTWGSLFSLLRVQPALGSFFTTSQNTPDPTVVLSHRFWQRELGGDPAVVGNSIWLDDEAYTIVGVAPASFAYPSSSVDLWRPMTERAEVLGDRSAHYLGAVARLRDDATIAGAQAELETLNHRLAAEYPDTNAGWQSAVMDLTEWMVGSSRRALLLLWAGVGLLLLAACSNVAHLMLARHADRRRELATRAAMGAGRWHLMRQLLTEASILAGLGCAVGIALAHAVVNWLPVIAAGALPRLDAVTVDGTVLTFAVVASGLTGLLFGIVPARAAGRLGSDGAATALHSARGQADEGGITRSGLIVAQVILASILVVAAGLVGRSLADLLDEDPGFDGDGVLSFRISPPMDFSFMQSDDMLGELARQRDGIAARFARLTSRLDALPGIRSVAAINELPLAGGRWLDSVTLVGVDDEPRTIRHRVVTERYFETLGIPLIAGRDFVEHEPMRIAIINAKAAQAFWGGAPADAIGRQIVLDDPAKTPATVVGVAGDVKTEGLAKSPEPVVYVPLRQALSGFPGTWSLSVLVKAEDVSPWTLVDDVRAAVAELEPELPIFDVTTLDERRREGVADTRLLSTLFTVFAVAALILAAVGLYGIVAYSVRRGQRAIGIRLALGAKAQDVVRRELRRGACLALFGITLGLGAALLGGRLLEAELYGVTARDPLTFLWAAATLLAVAVVASWIPARRAAWTDPATVLRAE